MNRDEFERKLLHVKYADPLRGDKTSDEIMAEFDRLTAEVASETRWHEEYRYHAEEMTKESKRLQDEVNAIKQASNMPEKYEYGLPAWVNYLYACAIGVHIHPDLAEMIESGRLVFERQPDRIDRKRLEVENKRLTEFTRRHSPDEIPPSVPETIGTEYERSIYILVDVGVLSIGWFDHHNKKYFSKMGGSSFQPKCWYFLPGSEK